MSFLESARNASSRKMRMDESPTCTHVSKNVAISSSIRLFFFLSFLPNVLPHSRRPNRHAISSFVWSCFAITPWMFTKISCVISWAQHWDIVRNSTKCIQVFPETRQNWILSQTNIHLNIIITNFLYNLNNVPQILLLCFLRFCYKWLSDRNSNTLLNWNYFTRPSTLNFP